MKLFDEDADTFWEAIGRGITILGILFISVLTIIVWFSSCKSAEIYNRINGASYSCSDFFWAADQINTQTQTIRIKN